MNPARRRTDRGRHVFQKGDDVVVRPLFDLENFGDRKPRFLADFSCVLFWDLAERGHRFASEDFDLQPDLVFALVRPDLAHLGTGITINHPAKIDCRGERESVLSAKKIAPADNPPERFEKFAWLKLANLGAEKLSVA